MNENLNLQLAQQRMHDLREAAKPRLRLLPRRSA